MTPYYYTLVNVMQYIDNKNKHNPPSGGRISLTSRTCRRRIMSESNAGKSMVTETVSVPIIPKGGKKISLNPHTVQNRRLLPLADLVTQNTMWLMECESNNVGSVKDPEDVQNLQDHKTTLRRLWDRTKKYNRGGGGTTLEFTHPVAFPTMGELQKMPNTPARQLAYLNWHLFRTMLEKQGSKLQVFIDAKAIDDIEKVIVELEEFIDVEFGKGAELDGETGKFDTGQPWPDYSRLGIIDPSPMGGTVSANEPSTAAPESIPPDTPDV